jgi:hypothetical protein
MGESRAFTLPGVGRPHCLTPLRRAATKAQPFRFDEVDVFDRFARKGAWQIWEAEGTINIPGVFSYLKEPGLWEMIDNNFVIYQQHRHVPDGHYRLGWMRNMYFSLPQEVARRDPVYCALQVAARPHKNLMPISFSEGLTTCFKIFYNREDRVRWGKSHAGAMSNMGWFDSCCRRSSTASRPKAADNSPMVRDHRGRRGAARSGRPELRWGSAV